MVVGKRGARDVRTGKKLIRKAGIRSQQAFELITHKSLATIAKYKTGYRTAWRFRHCREYMQRHGFKPPGTYDKNNQLEGTIFATPKEVKFLTNEVCGNVLWKAYFKHKATRSQLDAISKCLSFGYQLKTGEVGGQWPEVTASWKRCSPAGMSPPTRKLAATKYPQPGQVEKCFTTPWCEETGWPMQRWSVALLLTWDWILNGARSREDLKRIKQSTKHCIDVLAGYFYTEFAGGRCKCERRLGERDWKAYRTCLCQEVSTTDCRVTTSSATACSTRLALLGRSRLGVLNARSRVGSSFVIG